MNTLTSFIKRHAAMTFAVVTVTLTFATYLAPLPVESRALIFPVMVVFIPAIVAIALSALTDGWAGSSVSCEHPSRGASGSSGRESRWVWP